MSEEDIRKTFAKNLRKYLEMNHKQPADIVYDLDIPFSTVSNWINATKMPRMGKVELLAHYFRIEKSDLLEEKAHTPSPEDQRLLGLYHTLNASGREKVIEYITDLMDNPKYTEKESSQNLNVG